MKVQLKQLKNRRFILTMVLSLGILGLIILTYDRVDEYLVRDKINNIQSKIISSNFNDKLYDELTTEGIQPAGMAMNISRNGDKSVLIYLNNFDSSDEQVKIQTERVVNEVSKQNNLGSFKVKVQKIEIRN
ncbi:hypothetical protein GCM10008967_28220 [Bacillus carboniphilus]|uniref:Uncharacterized protein n=1 Tax=Bacillus carboniphilus TaxID=86663 RepID=A0ABP3G510_9BACI